MTTEVKAIKQFFAVVMLVFDSLQKEIWLFILFDVQVLIRLVVKRRDMLSFMWSLLTSILNYFLSFVRRLV